MERLSLPFLRSVTISFVLKYKKILKKRRSKAMNESLDYEINIIKKQEYNLHSF